MRFSNETLGSTEKIDNIRLLQWGQTEVQVPAEPARSNKHESGVSSEQALGPEAGGLALSTGAARGTHLGNGKTSDTGGA